VLAYTAKPSALGSLTGALRDALLILPASTDITPPTDRIVWDWAMVPTRKRPALHAAGASSKIIAVNLGNTSVGGGILHVSIEWTEDAS
jgi:hypothetical protein